MNDQLMLSTLFRWLHVLTAVVAVGGLVFQRFFLFPAARAALDEGRLKDLRERVMQRWRIFVIVAIPLLLVSGMYNFMTVSIAKGREFPSYHMIFGIKFVAALGVFFLASIMSGRSSAFEKLRNNVGFWGSVTAGLAVLVVLLGGVLSVLP